jgi:hypothetical protein
VTLEEPQRLVAQTVAGISQINFILPQLPDGAYTAYVGSGQFYSGSDFNAVVVNVGKP